MYPSRFFQLHVGLIGSPCFLPCFLVPGAIIIWIYFWNHHRILLSGQLSHRASICGVFKFAVQALGSTVRICIPSDATRKGLSFEVFECVSVLTRRAMKNRSRSWWGYIRATRRTSNLTPRRGRSSALFVYAMRKLPKRIRCPVIDVDASTKSHTIPIVVHKEHAYGAPAVSGWISIVNLQTPNACQQY
jgi:hypothetical protein